MRYQIVDISTQAVAEAYATLVYAFARQDTLNTEAKSYRYEVRFVRRVHR